MTALGMDRAAWQGRLAARDLRECHTLNLRFESRYRAGFSVTLEAGRVREIGVVSARWAD